MGYFNLNFSLIFDPLSLFFLFVIFLISLPAAIYSVTYLKGEYSFKKIILAWALLILFIISMALVVTCGNILFFLVFWEIMSLVSYFLVIFDTKQEKSIEAGIIYIIMSHIGTAFLMAAFLLMFKFANSFDFATVKAACQLMPDGLKNLIFLLLLIGFGTKAGIVPMHIWLPYAHPQAPSHISSIMSGVMIKTAIYGMLRFIFLILGINAAWWGSLVLILALISCLVGVIYALMEHDLKKLLAYHSVENIGIILLGIGSAMIFFKMNLPHLAVLALVAGLYHLVNHAIFKGLLFLCAGAVYKASATRNIEKLGGLIKNMPLTALCFLIGALGISALPPFNGFISEWLTLQAFFLGAIGVSAVGYKIFLGICAGLLALTSGLAAACFVKAFGITFLAMPRSEKAKDAKEVGLGMKIPLVFLSLLVIVFGLAAVPIIKLLTGVAQCALGLGSGVFNLSLNNFTIMPQQAPGVFLSSPLLILVFSLIALFLLAGLYFVFGRSLVRRAKTWDCGYYGLNARNEYTATAFSKPFRIAFNFFLLPYAKTEKLRDSFYHVRTFKYEVYTTPVFKRYIYEPVIKLVFKIAVLMRRIQPGSIHLYIAYIFVTIVSLVIIVSLR